MKITVARNAGFCFGVRRALDLTFKVRRDNPKKRIMTVGPIIHNPQVIEALAGCGVGILNKAEDLNDGDIAIIRAHGLAPAKADALKQRGGAIIDATCPMVLKVHALIRQAARTVDVIAIAGDRDHPEMEAHLGVAGDKGVLIENIGDIEKIAPQARVALVAQTTFEVGLFHEIAQALRGRVQNLDVTDTICRSTSRRQREVIELAHDHDTFVVIGGRNSANTLRLAEIAASEGRRVCKVETAAQLKECDLRDAERVAVIAGASTPQWLIEEVLAALKDYDAAPRLFNRLTSFLASSALLPALGALGLAMLTARPWNLRTLLIAGALAFATISTGRGIKAAARWSFASGLALGLAWRIGLKEFCLIMAVALARPLLEKLCQKPYQNNLIDAIFIAGCGVALPLWLCSYSPTPDSLVFAVYGVLFFLSGQISMGFKNLERDAITGNLSLARALGEQRGRQLVKFICGVLGGLLVLACLFSVIMPADIVLLLPLAGLWGLIALQSRKKFIDQRLLNLLIQSLWLFIPLAGLLN